MKEQLISFETAKLAKEKGYDNKLLTYYKNDLEKGDYLFEKLITNQTECISNFQSKYEYDKNISVAPSQSLLQQWLREVHEIEVNPNHSFTKGGIKLQYNVFIESFKYKYLGDYIYADNYEEVLELGLQEALKLIK